MSPSLLRAIPTLAVFVCACAPGRDEAALRDTPPHPAVSAPEPDPAATLPAPRAGAELLGRVLEDGWLEEFVGESVALRGEAAAPALLVRFWTEGCPYCERSLPAVESLRARYGQRGFESVAVFHAKPPSRAFDADDVRGWAEERGYSGPLAVDRGWRALRELWLDTGRRSATSASFLLDRTGAVRWVHPGPEFGPGPPGDPGARDYADLERAVEALLAEAR